MRRDQPSTSVHVTPRRILWSMLPTAKDEKKKHLISIFMDWLSRVHDIIMQWGHLPIEGTLLWIAVALHRHGVRMTFDVRIWKNGKDKSGHVSGK